jgi:hypothetical protein
VRVQTDIQITDGVTGEAKPAQLVLGLTLDEVDEASALWETALTENQQNPTITAQHLHWNWSLKARTVHGLTNYLLAGVRVDEEMQGLILWDELLTKARHPSQLGKDTVYIHFVSTAPWNDRSLTPSPRFVGVGSVLLLAAIDRSIELEYRGRIGLHALPQAEGFYRRCEFSDMGPDTEHDSLRYFEFTPAQAESFLTKIGVKR